MSKNPNSLYSRSFRQSQKELVTILDCIYNRS